MGKMMEELSLVLIKQQSVFGTAESTLLAADFAEVESGAKVTFEPDVQEVKFVGVNTGNSSSVVASVTGGVDISFPLRSGGAEGDTGLFGRIIPAFGFVLAASDEGGAVGNDKFVWTPSELRTDWKDLTVWGYSGNKASAILRKIYNVLFGGKLTLDFNSAIARISCQGKGAYSGVAIDGTQPTCTPSTVQTPALKGCTFSFLGSSNYIPLKFEIDFAQEAVVTLDPTETNLCGVTDLKRNGLKWSAQFYKDSVSSCAIETALVNRTYGAISIEWGSAPDKWTIATSKAQITSISDSNVNGVETWDASGIFINNDLSITLETV